MHSLTPGKESSCSPKLRNSDVQNVQSNNELHSHWTENTDLLLEGRHYIAESEEVAVFFLPMQAIDSATRDCGLAVIALYELVAALLKEQLLRKTLQVTKLKEIMDFHPRNKRHF